MSCGMAKRVSVGHIQIRENVDRDSPLAASPPDRRGMRRHEVRPIKPLLDFRCAAHGLGLAGRFRGAVPIRLIRRVRCVCDCLDFAPGGCPSEWCYRVALPLTPHCIAAVR